MIRKRPLAAFVLVALIALVGGGCGSNTATGTASSSNSTGIGASSASASNGAGTPATKKREKAEKFAECVRAHGVPHFPDPDATGNFNFAVDVTAATFTASTGSRSSTPITSHPPTNQVA